MADAEEQRRAAARGAGLRAELLAKLETGPQTATALLPKVKTPDVSLSEVAFQLDRLAGEGRTVGTIGGTYKLI